MKGGAARPPFFIRALRQFWRLASDRVHRRVMWLHLFQPKGAYQPFNTTRLNRYPKTFRFIRSELGAESKVNILSYGCSNGDEVVSLGVYFPFAIIRGIDINPANIELCRQRFVRDTAISFEAASSTAGESANSYDAIFCMAVLRHGDLAQPGITRCDHLIRFDDFALTIEDFRRCLKPGGLLAVQHSNFRVSDTPAARGFETVLRTAAREAAMTPIFGPDNRLMPGVFYTDIVFRKTIHAEATD
ncbi:MAG: class I SAM-dependent methyltransferase [Pseudolabrys sp.]